MVRRKMISKSVIVLVGIIYIKMITVSNRLYYLILKYNEPAQDGGIPTDLRVEII